MIGPLTCPGRMISLSHQAHSPPNSRRIDFEYLRALARHRSFWFLVVFALRSRDMDRNVLDALVEDHSPAEDSERNSQKHQTEPVNREVLAREVLVKR